MGRAATGSVALYADSLQVGGPVNTASATGTLVGTRFQAPLLDAIASWRKAQDDLPTRPEAVRRLVELGMTLKRAGVQMEHHAKPSNKNI